MRRRLSFAIGVYDHMADLLAGRVTAEGIELVPSHLPVEEIFYRATRYREFDVTELSLAKYAAMRAVDEHAYTALPVFASRVFRLSSMYVRNDSTLVDATQLRGARIGVPEWAQTAAVYTRGFLAHDAGVALEDVAWVQAGVNEAGRGEKVEIDLPPGVRLERRTDRCLDELLCAGEVDAVFSARPPRSSTGPGARLRRLYADWRLAEANHFARTGIFPIMHVVVVRNDVLERDPWIAMNLYQAFERAKDASLARLRDVTCSHVPLPWVPAVAADAASLLGEDWYPYGVEPNRPTLEAFLRYAREQGVMRRPLAPEALFAATTLGRPKV